MLRIMVVDEHHLFREGLAHVLAGAPDIEVVASVGDPAAALTQAAGYQPDAIIIDPWTPQMGGVDTVVRLHAACPAASLLVLTAMDAETDFLAALRAGAQAYLLKNSTSQELLLALQQVNQGGVVLGPWLTARLAAEYARLAGRLQDLDATNAVSLSGREREILQWVARGYSNKEIGVKLELSPHTVKAHLRSILDKLGLRRRSEAAAWAARHDLFPVD